MLIIKQFLELLVLFVLEERMFLPAPSLKPPPPPTTFLFHRERGNFTPTQETVTATCTFDHLQVPELLIYLIK
jgi:hypothetical protein